MTFRCGTICYAVEQGIGLLAKRFHDAGVIQEAALVMHSRPNHPEWWGIDAEFHLRHRPPYTNDQKFVDWIASLDAMLFFETPFDWEVINVARKLGVRTCVVPMYECTPRTIPHQPDRWLCPSKLDCRYFPGSPFLQIPVERAEWVRRDKAMRFLHNGGNLGLRGHKGTLEIMRAMRHVDSPITMTIRAQDAEGLHKLVRMVPEIKRDSRVTLEYGELPREELFRDHDVFVFAEKYNGLSLPLVEAWSHGLAVMTSDRFPMNDWLPRGPLIPVKGYRKACISGAYLEYDEAEVDPEAIAERIDLMWGQDISGLSDQGREFAEANSWERLRPAWMEALS